MSLLTKVVVALSVSYSLAKTSDPWFMAAAVLVATAATVCLVLRFYALRPKPSQDADHLVSLRRAAATSYLRRVK